MTHLAFRTLACAALLFGGWRTFAHGDLHERIAALTEQLDAGPPKAALLLERADLRRQHADFTAALTDASEAGRLRPDWAAAQLQRARILFDLKKFSEAKAAADASLQLESENADALVIRSRCLAAAGQTNKAIADLTRVLSRSEVAIPDLYMERAGLQAGAGDLAAAVSGLDEGIRRLGNTPSLALPALEYERRQAAFEAALKRVETLRTFLPQASQAALRGEILLEAGRNAEARGVFEAALTALSNPKSASRLPASESAALRIRLEAGLEHATAAPPQTDPTHPNKSSRHPQRPS